MSWHKESFYDKAKLIYDEWLALDCHHLILSSHLGSELESLDEPVTRDGEIEVYIRIEHAIDVFKYERFQFRATHAGNKGYIRHVLRTMVLNLAKEYFNIPKY